MERVRPGSLVLVLLLVVGSCNAVKPMKAMSVLWPVNRVL
jgi:hypothetical protein